MSTLTTKAEFLGAEVTLEIEFEGYVDQDSETRELEYKISSVDQLWIVGEDDKINVYPLLLESKEMKEYVNELILENH